ncbi:hypothetical protein C8J57DRAFT_1522113 [Mycena rebaudengoi]|nr:hypothetical protein C8J57DRAFT_1522113 [Mycena rebaudengoi]
MAFTLNSRNIRLVGSKLAADVEAPNGTSWNPYELDLNPYLEDLYGKFDTRAQYGNFYSSSRNLRVDNQGLLTAELNDCAGAWNVASIDLKVFVGVSGGVLLFRRLVEHQAIDTSATAVSLTGSVFSAFLMGSDGLMHYQEVNLIDHYANIDGSFRSNPGDNGFYNSARNVHLGEGGKSFILKAELRAGSGWRTTEVNRAVDIVNSYSRLLYTPPPSFWEKFLQAFEGWPLVGFVVAGIYALMGNMEAAQHAVSLSANSTIVMMGVTIGGLLGGPWGAAIGAATATIERYIFETLRNTISAAIGAGALKTWLDKLASRAMTTMFSEVNHGFGGKISSEVVDGMSTEISTSFEKIVNAIYSGVFPPEWHAVDAMVADLISARKIQGFALSMLQPLDEYKLSPDLFKASKFKAITLEK